MNKFLKNTLVIAVMVLISEFVINKSKILSIGTESDWFSFWGNVFGAGVGVLGAYIILQIQLNIESKKYIETQIDNTFFNMIDLFQNIQEKLGQESCTFLINRISESKNYYVKNKKKKEREELYQKNEKVIRQGSKSLKTEEALKDTVAGTHIDYMTYPGTDTERRIINFTAAYKSMIKEGDFVKPSSKKGKEIIDELDGIFKQFESIDDKYDNYILEEEETFRIVNDVFSFNHSKVGAFLRMFHRIVKYIMDSKLSTKKKKEYLGMLRALLSSDEILVIFYNTFYSNRGKGLKKQLERKMKGEEKQELTEFFADKSEIEEHLKSGGTIDLPFFKFRDLIFPELDLIKIKSLTNYK